MNLQLKDYLARLTLPKLGTVIERGGMKVFCVTRNFSDTTCFRNEDEYLRLQAFVTRKPNVDIGFISAPPSFERLIQYRVASIETVWIHPNKHIHFFRHVILIEPAKTADRESFAALAKKFQEAE